MTIQYGAEKMRIAWRITKARIHTDCHIIYMLIALSWLLPFYIVKRFTTKLPNVRLLNKSQVITFPLARYYFSRRPWANEHSFVSKQALYVTCGKNANILEYKFFQKLARVICIVAGDIDLT